MQAEPEGAQDRVDDEEGQEEQRRQHEEIGGAALVGEVAAAGANGRRGGKDVAIMRMSCNYSERENDAGRAERIDPAGPPPYVARESSP